MDHPVIPHTISGLSELAPRSRAILCDVWGVIHNGVAAFAPAIDALIRFRDQGGVVVLITNAPRPDWSVVEQLDRLKVDRRAYDRVVTSGDVAREVLASHAGARVFHLGPDRDLVLYRDLDLELTDSARALLVSCTGLFNEDTETAADYDPMLLDFAYRGIEMICANPDLVVDRGGKLIPCAGAIAVRYREHGGDATVLGKPFRAIYDLAIAAIQDIAGTRIPTEELVAIGDGVSTDIRGANDMGIRAVFVTNGIHAAEYAADPASIAGFLRRSGAAADGVMGRLSW
jgi:HAD superfamily hydrolase (TIGR01450 family)